MTRFLYPDASAFFAAFLLLPHWTPLQYRTMRAFLSAGRRESCVSKLFSGMLIAPLMCASWNSSGVRVSTRTRSFFSSIKTLSSAVAMTRNSFSTAGVVTGTRTAVNSAMKSSFRANCMLDLR